jgi:hypothetical protein
MGRSGWSQLPAKRKINSTDEIEITPEMIEAGIEAYIDGEEYFEGRDDIVMRIFKKMIAASDVRSAK